LHELDEDECADGSAREHDRPGAAVKDEVRAARPLTITTMVSLARVRRTTLWLEPSVNWRTERR